MFGRNLEDLIKKTHEPRSFDEDFFDFNDTIHSWTTVYRFFFLADMIKKTQFMLGVGQKNISNYKVNGYSTEFSNEGPTYKVGVSYWLDGATTIHKTINEEIDVQDGMVSNSFKFQKENGGYTFKLDEIDTNVNLDDGVSKTDYVRFKAGITPFYRHNKYLPFKGIIMGEEVSKGYAFIQKVNLNMPFLPWRWGRVFFDERAQLDFYEPKILFPLYKSINFESQDQKMEFKLNQKITFKNSLWSINGTTPTGETIDARIRTYNQVPQSFETPRSIFVYTEMPSSLDHLEIKRGDDVLFTKESLGESVANCEEAHYTKMII
jgi:hypothetical protein